MNNTIKNSLRFTVLTVISVLLLSSCSDWTAYESLPVKTPSFEGQNPGLYEEYMEGLRAYKARPHKVTIVTFDNNVNAPVKQSEHLTILPDSIDYISLQNPDMLHYVIVKEMDEVRKKGTRVIYDIDFAIIEAEWQLIVKADEEGELTEEDAFEYITERTDEMLALCDKYGYDGLTFTYAGRSDVSLTEEMRVIYTGRQKLFFDLIAAWREANPSKSFSYIGNPQYLYDENKPLLAKCDYIVLMTDMLKNGTAFTVRTQMAIDSGNVPTDRFIPSVHSIRPDDDDRIYGYFGVVDENGNNIRSITGGAGWVATPSSDFTRSGLFIRNAQYDYYDNTPVYRYIREAIGIMNPSPKN